MPTECPKQSVMPLVTMNSANALQEKKIGPAIMATAVIAISHNDFVGAQRTVPSSGFVVSSAMIRSEPATSRIRPSAVRSHVTIMRERWE